MTNAPAAGDAVTIPASVPEPFVHLDNRALIVSAGVNTALFGGAQLRFVAETLQIIAAEGRATRKLGTTALGGFRAGQGRITLFAGRPDRLAVVMLDAGPFDDLRAALDRQLAQPATG